MTAKDDMKLLDRYLELKEEERALKTGISSLKEELDAIEETVIGLIESIPEEKYEGVSGTLKVVSRKTYGDYPAYIQAKAEEVKALQDKAKQTGECEQKISKYIKFS